MIEFNRASQVFTIEGCRFTIGSPLKDVETCKIDFGVRHFPAQQMDVAEAKVDGLYVNLYFSEGRLQTGSFMVSIPGPKSWDRFEQIERERRAAHRDLMHRIVGAEAWSTPTMRIEMIRDAKNGAEIISFWSPADDDPA